MSHATNKGLIEKVSTVTFKSISGQWRFALDDLSTCPLFERIPEGTESYFALSDIDSISNPAPDLPAIPAITATPVFQVSPPSITSISLAEVEETAADVIEAPQMTHWQQRAFSCFQGLYDDAVSYRAGMNYKLDFNHGICDNIGRFTNDDDQMTNVKDNLIRRTPSYSGEHHYPVKSHNEQRSAEWAWDYTSNKWSDEYGNNRLTQLGEIINLIKNEWTDDLIQRMTPARAAGVFVNDKVWNKEVSEVWTFVRDDGSNDPYFRREDGRETSCHLRHIQPIGSVMSGLTFAEIMQSVKELTEKKADLLKQQAAINTQLAEMDTDFARFDIELAHTFGVRRIK